MLKDSRVAAVVATADLERARRFYTETLGLGVMSEDPAGIVFTAGAGTAILVYLRPEHSPAPQTIATFEVDDVAQMVRDLEAKGVRFEDYDMPGIKTVDHVADLGGQKAAWFTDPDGNIIAIGTM
ncbi:MAG: VOC family protein [Chloroflexi bacterium]|nr:VOC family protein [Chloroflexota bacterium]